jgi:hypothetical protein
MYRKKQYGQSQTNTCPFCNKLATSKNKQGITVCRQHTDKMLDLKCACGSWLEIKEGKWGAYCNCLDCGNINFKKALEINPKATQTATTTQKPAFKTQSPNKPFKPKPREKKETTITTDDIDYF